MSSASLSNSPSTSSGRAEETEFVVEEVEVHVEEDEADDAGKSVEEEEIFDECLEKYQAVQENCLEEMRLPLDVVDAVKQAWSQFVSTQSSRDAAGEAIYAALFDSAPTLQNLFMTPRSVMALRFMNGIVCIIMASHDPAALKMEVESIGFRHLERELTASRVAVFREAIVELLDMELPNGLTSKAKMGLQAILNYAGGAFIYIRQNYLARVKVIQRSWRIANNKGAVEEEDAKSAESEQQQQQPSNSRDFLQKSLEETVSGRAEGRKDSRRSDGSKNTSATELKVPTTFNEMFLFNAAVMGFSSSGSWMHNILEQFDGIVTNVANSYRLQEECDVLSLVLARHSGSIKLSEFKAVMLASLRSLVPKEWDSNHEVAWNWLWENVERMLRMQICKPQAFEAALERFVMSLDETLLLHLRKGIYQEFFSMAPSGQDYFKQSTTRLYFIADRIIEMTMEIFRNPRQMVEDISALGLRHVGYEVPSELFSPFVNAAVEVMSGMTKDETATSAFRWSLTLVSKILVRTQLEGSTIVMKAINTNQEKALRKAIAVSPRGQRALELLEIRVGTQTISPLYWALESGSLLSAKAMIHDLLTIRADRDNYYYGCDDLFRRHPKVVQKLCQESPTMLPHLMDGLLWRSRVAGQGKRRVNYYVKHLLQDEEGGFNQALEWLVELKDPKVISHPVVALFADILWSRLAIHYFLFGRLYFLFTLCVFAASQAILPHGDQPSTVQENVAVFALRCFIYLGSMCQLLVRQLKMLWRDVKTGAIERTWGVPLPEHLCAQELGNIALFWTLLLMCIQEPIFWCLSNMHGDFPGAGLFTSACPAGKEHSEAYAVFSCIAMLLYCALVLDLSIISMRISAFVLVCGSVMAEVGLFLMAAAFLIVSFALSISTLSQQAAAFQGFDHAAYSLFAMMLGLYPSDQLVDVQAYMGIMIVVSMFIIAVVIFLLNLLVAQLNQAYQIIFPDMQGYARLTRAGVVVSAVEQVSHSRWARFLQSLHLDERLEFNEGDVGLAGGIQVNEPSWAHPTTVDSIRRFGGSTATNMPWPEEDNLLTDEDRFDRLEKLMIKCNKSKNKKKRHMSGVSSGDVSKTSGSGGGSWSSNSSDSHDSSER
ncbi:unnamed protein product [Effrenium voratum]|uniref:Ion transport domain-containing protein n=1 Tax=Effrenium voratum TaxID=2562239 RepID=A0AA36NEU5_9DINO|nr:unnamed protein product [Effrenium voratum]CAJ1442945.1 unnamed protein product [Effrenium voratum]